jgi:phosphoserine phosphatase
MRHSESSRQSAGHGVGFPWTHGPNRLYIGSITIGAHFRDDRYRRFVRTAFCFDLDGTITRAELLPIIAKEVGLVDEIGLLTELTIKGIIPFEKSFRLRCRLLASVPIATVNAAVAKVPLHEEVVEFIRDHADQCFVVTGNLDVWIAPLLQQIPCAFFSSTAEVENGHLGEVTHVLNKAEAIPELRSRFDTIVAIGEGRNDVPMFELADIGIAHGAIHEPNEMLQEIATYRTVDEAGLCQLLNALSMPLPDFDLTQSREAVG